MASASTEGNPMSNFLSAIFCCNQRKNTPAILTQVSLSSATAEDELPPLPKTTKSQRSTSRAGGRGADSSAGPDYYAIYLRPRKLPRSGDIDAAKEFNRRWGGIHVKLCSFAPDKGEGSKAVPAHGTALEDAVRAMRVAAVNASGAMSLSGWKLPDDAELPVTYARDSGVAMLKMPEDSAGLKALCKTAATANLKKPRKPNELHVTIGDSARADRVRAALLECETWELAIAKSPRSEQGVRVNGFLEVTPIRFGDDSSASPRRGKRVHVYAPSLPSQYAGSQKGD